MAPRTPLRHPRAYFEARGFYVRPAFLAVAAATLSLVAAFVGFGYLLTDKLQSAGHEAAAAAVWEVFGGYLFQLVIALFVGWLIVAAILHFLSLAFVSHDGEFTDTLAITGWGTAPTVLSSVVAFGLLASALGDTSVASPRMFADEFHRNLANTQLLTALVSFVVATWQTYFYANGLAVAFDADAARTGAVAAVVAYGGWLLSVL